jgi:glyoxylase-like metal-dependent hydrolase (beta-lactamase superfamily II)
MIPWDVLPLETPTLPPGTHTNCALVGAGPFLVVDPGSPYEAEQARLVAALETRPREGFLGVFLTHHHADHTGALGAVRAWLGQKLDVYAHPDTLAKLDLPADRLVPTEDSARLAVGGGLLGAMHTPGHTRGHMALVDAEQGWAYVGDLVASQGTILVDPPDGDMAAYLDSLARVRALGLRRAIPSHGDPLDDPDAWLGFYISHRLAREQKVLAALEGAWEPLEDLLPRAYADAAPAAWPLARRSLLAHLLKLLDEGKAQREGARWRRA